MGCQLKVCAGLILPRIPNLGNSEAALLRRDGRLAITPGGENNHSNRRQAVNVSSPTARHNAPFSGVGGGNTQGRQ